ncbi:hypothetical protein ID866_5596 [Astraeus odoratus]|nr:hypothetical protein ID866_5596 [Astraeus odoratus]
MLPSHLGWSSLAIVAIAWLSVGPLRVTAQQSNTTCLSQYNWMDNSKGQNPCLVAAYVQGVCDGGQFTVDPLDPNTHYVGPYADEANDCECNTITYSLISACSICQNRTYIAWSSWSFNCSTVYPSIYPEDIPSGTAVPNWAYQDVVTSDSFNVTLAQLTGDAPESTATKAPSTATGVTSSTAVSASLTSTSAGALASTTTQASSSSSNVGPIVGGTVGGVVILAAAAAFVTWLCMRRRRKATPPSALYDGNTPGVTNSMYTATSPFTSPVTQPKLYDPSDPSTFPTSPPSPTIHTSSGYQNPSIHSNIYGSQTGRPGGYSGAPEL